MRIVITGAAGFLGQRLTSALLQLRQLTNSAGQLEPIEKITLFDIIAPPALNDSRVEIVTGDSTNPSTFNSLIDANTSSVFHLAAIVSSQAEEDFDLGMHVNIDAARSLFERIRQLGTSAKVVTTSSVAVFGGDLPEIVPDSHVWSPRSSYGTQKAITDLLLSDYSRRGFIDGRSLRMPTIVVRPGKPNRAASSFASSIIREPLNHQPAICPISPESKLWLMSPGLAIRNIIQGHELPSSALISGRVINMPGLTVTVDEMLQSLERIAGTATAQRVTFTPDPAIERIVNSWPGNFSADYAHALGFQYDHDFDSIIHQFIQDTHPGQAQ